VCVSAGRGQGGVLGGQDGTLGVHRPAESKDAPRPRLPLHLGLGPNKPPLLHPTGMETVTASLLASGISLKALQFGIFYLLCFSLIIAVPSVASSALGGMCVAVISR